MRTFRFHFAIRGGSLSIHKPHEDASGWMELGFGIDDGAGPLPCFVRLSDIKEQVENVVIHRGLAAEVDVAGTDLDSAAETAHYRLEAVLSLLALHTNTTLGPSRFDLGYETTEGASKTPYIQNSYLDGDLLKRKRGFSDDGFRFLVEAALKSSNDRVIRAVRWYRKGLMEDDPIDRFMSYWVGLENLNPILMDLLGQQPEMRPCANCGAPYEVPTAKGIRSLFIHQSPDRGDDFKLCRDLRVDLQHGRGRLSDMSERVSKCGDICRLILRRGIYLCIGLRPEEIDTDPPPIYNLILPRIEYRGEFDISPDDLNQVPRLTFEEINTSVEDHEDGRRTVRFQDVVDSDVPASVTIQTTLISELGVKCSISDVREIPKGARNL